MALLLVEVEEEEEEELLLLFEFSLAEERCADSLGGGSGEVR